MSITKAIIPVAGFGTRRLPITKAVEKSMLPVGNRPITDYIIEDCARAGIKDIYIVINDSACSQIKTYYGENVPLTEFLTERGATEKLEKLKTVPDGVNIHYVAQPAGRYGTAITVKLVVDTFGIDEQIVFANGDDFFWNAPEGSQIKDLLAHVESDDEAVVTGLRSSKEDISAKFAEVRVDENSMVTSIVEKPPIDTVVSDLANINRYVLSPKLLEFICKYVDENDFGANDQEYYLTDPVDEYVKAGYKLRAVPAVGEFMDCGSVEGWLKANNTVAASL